MTRKNGRTDDGGEAAGTSPGPRRTRRRPRRDSEVNRERLLAAAISAMLREGRNVPLATIAAEAGVGVATLYRKYADRQALMHEIEHRAYGLLVHILEEIEELGCPGREAVGEYLTRCLEVGDQLVLPLHGAPPLMTAEAVRARQTINRHLDAFLDRGRSDGTIRAEVNATDVIVFTALITQPLSYGPSWPRMAGRQIAIFLNALAVDGPIGIPGPEITQRDIEDSFAAQDAT
ncbi:TetR/AcrR family transcriptional regulator [Actinomadura rubrisoli]|uniref:TetR/AcrR family transcriptional regulator n=1 Tax=Actinomadura rubrisoli TaxID=2530368 RepID=A0A4R5CAS8_9ACTN|nr:TetR/AcrR family transcriptional regulator [Actinomadura rubrisoli]TDD96445.1 TetR/AcrR family transcriptional regulator [Actinomadura rubrisoli]